VSSIQNTISVARVASYLASNEIANNKMYGGNLDERLPLMLTTERIIIERIYSSVPTYPNLQLAADYLYDLCGKYQIPAQAIVDGGGGGSAPGSASYSTIERKDFIVSSGSYLPTGTTSQTLTYFIGAGLDFQIGDVSQSTLNTESSYFTWDRNTGAFTCFPALNDGDLIALIPTR
jgi:hypothetical protein